MVHPPGPNLLALETYLDESGFEVDSLLPGSGIPDSIPLSKSAALLIHAEGAIP